MLFRSDNYSIDIGVYPVAPGTQIEWWFPSVDITISQQIVITGGTGEGSFKQTTWNQYWECYDVCDNNSNASVTGLNNFIFGVPFTISLNIHQGSPGPEISSASLSSAGTSLEGGGGSGFNESFIILDANGNPVSDAVVTQTPEPRYVWLVIAATLGLGLISAHVRR